jgi:hypothetical protein
MKRDVLGGGQPGGLAAAPKKYHQLAFRNSLLQIGINPDVMEGSLGPSDYLGAAVQTKPGGLQNSPSLPLPYGLRAPP